METAELFINSLLLQQQQIVWFGLVTFLGLVILIATYHGRTLFLQWHSLNHRWAGAALLSWLLYGSWHAVNIAVTASTTTRSSTNDEGNQDNKNNNFWFWYNVILGLLGITTAVTAARDFPHKYVRNKVGQSGALSQTAIVTQAEMVEHAFYQGLNLWQALYLHFMTQTTTITTNAASKNNNYQYYFSSIGIRLIALWVVTAPWYVRKQFPVHSFSNNWKNEQKGARHKETIMYKIKKWQYVFYKHVILHGLNITVCIQPHRFNNHNNNNTSQWQLFWICLNAAYVLEFFLQSLVKRKILSQSTMLILNQWLMIVSSMAAMQSVLQTVMWPICLASVALNFSHRHHDVFNTMIVAVVAQGLLFCSVFY